MRPPAILVILAALATGCADTAGPTPEAGQAAPSAAPSAATADKPAPALPAAAKLPRVVYYVISEA